MRIALDTNVLAYAEGINRAAMANERTRMNGNEEGLNRGLKSTAAR